MKASFSLVIGSSDPEQVSLKYLIVPYLASLWENLYTVIPLKLSLHSYNCLHDPSSLWYLAYSYNVQFLYKWFANPRT